MGRRFTSCVIALSALVLAPAAAQADVRAGVATVDA
jgi:hypothetical protein